jgi:hypothetical protein
MPVEFYLHLKKPTAIFNGETYNSYISKQEVANK